PLPSGYASFTHSEWRGLAARRAAVCIELAGSDRSPWLVELATGCCERSPEAMCDMCSSAGGCLWHAVSAPAIRQLVRKTREDMGSPIEGRLWMALRIGRQ